MKNTTIKSIGIINVDNISIGCGNLELHIPIDKMDKTSENIVNTCIGFFKQDYPDAEDLSYDFRLIYSFGNCGPEYEAGVYIWQSDDESKVEYYDNFPVALTKKDATTIKRYMMDKFKESLGL